MTVAEMESLFEEKRVQMRHAILGEDAKVSASGFIDTTRGAVLTSDRALALARDKLATDLSKKADKDRRAALSPINNAGREKRLRGEVLHLQEPAWLRRAKAVGVSVVELKRTARSFAERSAIAGHRVIMKRQDALKRHGGPVHSSSMVTWQPKLLQLLMFFLNKLVLV